MSQSVDKKLDLSQFPRGAIGIKGLPVNRNARLPSIRTPRDLTLGTQAKRTFTPNIPARREKCNIEPQKANSVQAIASDADKNDSKLPSKFEKTRKKEKGQIIQTDGSVFGEGIAASKKVKNKESSHSITKSEMSSGGRLSSVKKEARDVDMKDMSEEMSRLLNDNFIDDGSEDEDQNDEMQPVIYPIQKSETSVKEEKVKQPPDFNNQDFAKELGFDVRKISKFIKKEKVDGHSKKVLVNEADLPKNEITSILTADHTQAQFLLLQFPECIAPMETRGQSQTINDNIPINDDQKAHHTLSSLAEGQIGKLQILKSGRARLVIGGVHYDLDSINSLKTRHDVVSIETDSDSGHIATLGSVKNKLCFAPDIEKILS